MMQLNRQSIRNKKAWQDAAIELPQFNYDQMLAVTQRNPGWVHFGAGNLFRGFPAVLQQKLLDSGKADSGIVVVEAFDVEIIERIYRPYDNLSLVVIMEPNGNLVKKVVGSIGESLIGDVSQPNDWQRLQAIFKSASLQMASFTITEKGYNLQKISGEYFDVVLEDMEKGPDRPQHIMAKVAALAYTRYQNGELPMAFVSMDNCSHNGEQLYCAIESIAQKWVENRKVESGFLTYLRDPSKVSFPWSMIDKITPRPSESVQARLTDLGLTDAEIVCTSKNTYIAPFINAERAQYLVIEEHFPNGRPALEDAGVFFTDRETVERVEKMKVCTCLNPLHTALAIFGCLLGYRRIADEMKDVQLHKLVEKIGYQEGLRVVENPGIINPADFIREVIEERLPNPYIPDSPQRIASDTSQKIGIRFGETIKAYLKNPDLNPAGLIFIPLVIAGWCRYLLGLDDQGTAMPLSPDPMLEVLRVYLAGVKLGEPTSVGNCLQPILSNEKLFGLNLYEAGLGGKIEYYFSEMLTGINAVRMTLQKYVG